MKNRINLIGLIVFIFATLDAFAGSCTSGQLTKLLDQGFSREEILNVCGKSSPNQPSINLNGQWRFISEGPYGIVNEYWRLSWNSENLSISARRQRNFQYTWVPITLTRQQVAGDNIQITIKDDVYSSTTYNFTIRNNERIEGSYTSTDSFISDMGGASVDALLSVPTDFGSAQKYRGVARLIRE